MTFTGTRKSTLAELALTHLYTEATRNNEDPSEDTELAYHTLEEALEELERLKRYPTEQEVIDALKEYTGYNVIFEKDNNEFAYTEVEDGLISDFITETQLKSLSITMYLPPHLITMIGRFYEGLEREDSNA